MFRVLTYILFVASFLALPVSTNAQSVPNGLRIQATCVQMGELAHGLNKVVNEMQLYNNSADIWRGSRSCTWRDPRTVIQESIIFIGWYKTKPRRARDKAFWVPIYFAEYPETKKRLELAPGLSLGQETGFFRPHGAFRADLWGLPADCERRWIERRERRGVVRVYGADREGSLSYCAKPVYLGDRLNESRRNRRRP